MIHQDTDLAILGQILMNFWCDSKKQHMNVIKKEKKRKRMIERSESSFHIMLQSGSENL